MTLSYEEQRLANIRANEALLLSLGLASPSKPKPQPKAKVKAKPAPKPKSTTAAKRKIAEAEYEADDTESETEESTGEDQDEQPRKRQRKAKSKGKSKETVPDGVRRSGRATRQPKRFDPGVPSESESESDGEYAYRPPRRVGDAEPQRRAQRLGKRIHDPQQFGHIPGVPVGTWWLSRMDCSTAAVHGPPVAGISGNAERGAWSVALSGGYPDDVDMGEMFTYTGSGGRDLKGTRTAPKNLRTAPQTFDQSFDNHFNAALKRSAETRKPVRVIRGFKLDSPYAPAEGYRYDGLYVVERAWMAPGLTKKLLVCRYAFRRLPGQPPLPVRGEEGEEGEEGEDEGEGEEGEEVGENEEEEDEAAVEREVADEAPVRRTRSRGTSSAIKNGSHIATPSSTFLGVELDATPKARSSRDTSTASETNGSRTPTSRRTRATRAEVSLSASANDSPEPRTERPVRAARARASLPAKLEPEPTLRRSRRSLAVA